MSIVEPWPQNQYDNTIYTLSQFNSSNCSIYICGGEYKPIPEGNWAIVITGVVAIDREGKVVLLSDDPIDDVAQRFWKAITDNFPIVLNK